MALGICARIGVVLVVALSVILGLAARQWNPKESVAYNIVLFLFPLFTPRVLPQDYETLEEQAAAFDSWTKKMANQATSKTGVASNGPAFYEAYYGTNQTRLENVLVPSKDDPDYFIPVTCACPHNATTEIKLPLIFFTYSGGFILGSIEFELPISRWLAQEANAIVCSIGYRKAPLNPYPVPINDIVDAAVGILKRQVPVEAGLQTSIDFARLATFGQSAGGYMSAQLVRRLTEIGYQFKCQISLIPMAKPHSGTESMRKNWNDVWSGPNNAYAWSVFLPGDDGTLAADWRVSLLKDPPEKIVRRLPPTYVEIHTRDVLRDEGEMYARRLEAQGKLIELREYDVSHIGSAPALARGGSAEDAMDRAVEVLKRYL